MALTTPPKVQKLQAALHAKAKGSPDLRFHALYDKVYRRDVLAFAYACSKSKAKRPDGTAGVDGQTFTDIEAYGVDRWLDELARELQEQTYRPEAVKRVWIPKASGGLRPLGIPTVKDRVVQTAAKLVLEPIFDADLQDEQYAYRSGRSPNDAVRRVHREVSAGRDEVVDADLSGYFDSIPHAELMQCLRRRIVDGAMLHLLKMWLEQPAEETDDRGRKHQTTRCRDEKRGTPQGAPISSLLANVYMRRFVLAWERQGHRRRLDAVIVNFADDFVICCPRGRAEAASAVMRKLMAKLKLTVNETKTSIRRLPEDTFDFLGYTIGRRWSPRTGRAYYGTYPSKKKVTAKCRSISDLLKALPSRRTPAEAVAKLNETLVGFANYFTLGPVSKAFRAVDAHTRHVLRQWLRRKHQTQTAGIRRFSDRYMDQKLGLVRLKSRPRRFSCAKA